MRFMLLWKQQIFLRNNLIKVNESVLQPDIGGWVRGSQVEGKAQLHSSRPKRPS
jgi:hypothetical protein